MPLSILIAASSLLEVRGFVVGKVRVQFYPDQGVRIEARGPEGFEDRATFNVVSRPKQVSAIRREVKGGTELVSERLRVFVPSAGTLKGILIREGEATKYEHKIVPALAPFPSPGGASEGYAFADSPRIVPSPVGAAPFRSEGRSETSGWDLGNQADDVYVLLDPKYQDLRRSFLALTGPIPMPPLYAFGLWHSRFHPYTETSALQTIDTYRSKGFPLDVFVIDTDWRMGASHGYQINKDLFPDMKRFLAKAHQRGVRVVFNDHPEPVAKTALDPQELKTRSEGLQGLLRLGADAWWYDRNWKTKLIEPVPGLVKEVWGAALFHDITLAARPDRRPLVLSNVPGIKHGKRQEPDPVATHRYPIWWTGDTGGQWNYLRQGIENAVDSGVESFLPYLSEDLGGHWGRPKPDLYTRFLQFGALSPVMRVHSTKGETREPWRYGSEAESIALAYSKLRYRLLPTIYATARRAYEDGTPILRRCDLEWPEVPGSERSDQYLLGDDLLVAPIYEVAQPVGSPSKRKVWIPPGRWIDLWGSGSVRGPKEIETVSDTTKIPLFVRAGGLILTTSEADRTEKARWLTLVAECFPTSGTSTVRILYEDDGISNDYFKRGFRKTSLTLSRHGAEVVLRYVPQYAFKGLARARNWKLRLHLAPGESISAASVGGRPLRVKSMPRPTSTRIWTPLDDTAAGRDSYEIVLPPTIPANSSFEVRIRLR